MTFLFINYWAWLLAALLLGVAVGWLAWSNERRDGWFVGWLRWWGIAFAIGLAVALLKWLPGRAGLYLETALWLFAAYIIGCFIGGWLRATFGANDELAATARVWAVDSAAAASAAKAASVATPPATLPGFPPPGLPFRPGDADDLLRIRGVGPRNGAALNELGVYHVRQIADWSADNAAWVGAKLGGPGRVEREDWIGQAKLLTAGGDTAYSAFVKSGVIKPGADADEPLGAADIAVVKGDITAGGVAAREAAEAEARAHEAAAVAAAAAKADADAKAAAAAALADFDARAAATKARAGRSRG